MYIPTLDAAYQECMQLYRTSSTISRIKKLQAIADSAGIWREVFLAALRYAYDPYKRYHVTRGAVRGSGTDVLGLELDHLVLLDKLSTREISGNAAPYAVSQVCQRLTPVSAEMFKRILLKDLRIGLGTASINKAFPGLVPEHKVMLAKPMEWHRVKYPCISTVKLDGVRAIYRDGVFYTRNGKILRGLEALAERLNGAPVLDGELVCPGMDFQTSSGQLRSFADTPNAQFNIIDLPEHPSRNLLTRLAEARRWVELLVDIVPWRHVCSMEEIEQHYQACLDAGYEGVVVKPMEYEYVNKRSFDWMKLKAINTVDACIVDIFTGTGKYSSSAGGVIIQMPDSEVLVRVGSGFSDQQRDEIYAAPDEYIGRTIEIKYHEVTPDGSLRHPRFYRWRDDK